MRRTTLSPITRKHFLETVMVIISAELADSLCGVVDAVFIGRGLGSDAIAAHGVAVPVFTFLCIFAYMAASGILQACTASVGKGDLRQANGIFHLATLATLALASLFSIVGWFFPFWVARMLGANGAPILPLAAEYIRGTAPGCIPLMLFLVLVPALQLDGKWPLIHIGSALMAVSDIGFDLLNIYVLHWGMFGMGMATSVSYLLGLGVLLLYFLQKKRLFKLRWKDFRKARADAFMAAALPTGVRISARMLSIVFINMMVLQAAGTRGMAAMAVQRNIDSLVLAFVLGVAGSVLSFTSINYGEQDRDGLRETMRLGLRYTWGLVGLIALGLFFMAPNVVSLYLDKVDPSFDLTVRAVRWLALSLPFLSWNWNCGSFLQGVQKTWPSTVMFVMSELVSLCLCCLLGKLLFGIEGIFGAFAVSQLLVTVVHTTQSSIRWRTAARFFGKPFGVPADNRYSKTLTTQTEMQDLARELGDFCVERGVPVEKARKVAPYAETMCNLIFDYGFHDGKQHFLEVRLAVSDSAVIIRFRDDCHRFNIIELTSSLQESLAHPENKMAVQMVMDGVKEITYYNSLNSNNLMVVI